MKKILLSAIGAVLLGAAMSAFVTVNRHSILNSNVNALAGEIMKSSKCYNSITAAEGQWVLYCSGCVIIPGNPAAFSSSSTCISKHDPILQ